MRKSSLYWVFFLVATILAGCSGNSFNGERKYKKLNDEFYPALIGMNEDKMAETNPSLGLIEGTQLTEPIKIEKFNYALWEVDKYNEFMKGDTPSTVHPNLWRMEKLNNYNGIYQAYPAPEVGSDNKNGIVYQVRSYDLSWNIIEPLD